MPDFVEVGDGTGIFTDLVLVVNRVTWKPFVRGRERVEVWGDPDTLVRLRSAYLQHAPFSLKITTKYKELYHRPAVQVHYLDSDVPNHYILQVILL